MVLFTYKEQEEVLVVVFEEEKVVLEERKEEVVVVFVVKITLFTVTAAFPWKLELRRMRDSSLTMHTM
jgi:hypothetical protein